MTPNQLRTEAEWLAQRSRFDRIDYLFEVAHCPHRGPEEAEALRREVERIKREG